MTDKELVIEIPQIGAVNVEVVGQVFKMDVDNLLAFGISYGFDIGSQGLTPPLGYVPGSTMKDVK